MQKLHLQCNLKSKEKLEVALITSSFESKLFKATSNTLSSWPTTAELFSIADHSYIYEDLISILARIKHWLKSKRTEKHKWIRKVILKDFRINWVSNEKWVHWICSCHGREIQNTCKALHYLWDDWGILRCGFCK